MLPFSANISLMFTEWSFADRFKAAGDAGFEAVEFLFTEGFSADQIALLLSDNKLGQVLANMPLRRDSKGLAAIEGAQFEFKRDFLRGMHFATTCKAPLIHMTAGVVEDHDYEFACEVFKENALWAVEIATEVGVTVVIEAINQVSVNNYFVRSLSDAMEWGKRCPGLGFILDLYHASMDGNDPLVTLDSYALQAAHVQLAGYPGRNEPNIGQLPLSDIVGTLSHHNYSGWVGCEYIPAHGTIEGLGWMLQL
ncbi:TIM barrel protein [Pseudomonas sp. MAFF 301449]|uniref:TIM barrel protein n=1 Tax=Pseudomonas cyclaminis TaxID=2781239 RepID=A0ABR9SSP6_9PSED|nr:TIM barrel protein [Pseudomonas cyclaminis]MBE8591943.1 TIM barrel protein [Pseudomonas cyclaminis]MBE8600140.1 TIM barrel protein [Pseudomonas cyclaminis]